MTVQELRDRCNELLSDIEPDSTFDGDGGFCIGDRSTDDLRIRGFPDLGQVVISRYGKVITQFETAIVGGVLVIYV